MLAGKSVPAAAPAVENADEEAAETQDEAVSAVEQATQTTKDYLIRQWSRTSQEFEEVVAAVFRALDYTATTQQGTRDLGVDVIHADRSASRRRS